MDNSVSAFLHLGSRDIKDVEKVKDAITSVAFKALSGSTVSVPLMLCHSCYSLPTSRALPPLPADLATSGLPPSSPFSFFFFFLFVVEKVRTGETRVLVYPSQDERPPGCLLTDFMALFLVCKRGVVCARVEVLDGSERLPISNRGCDQFSVPIHEYFLFLCFGGSCFFLVLSESGGEKPLAVPSPKASGRAVASDNTNG